MIDETALGNFLGKDLSSDAKATQVVAAVNAWIANYTGRSWGMNTVITDELQDYHPVVWLDHMDVISVEAVRIGSAFNSGSRQLIAAGGYSVSPTGRLVLNPAGVDEYSRRNYDAVSVDYTYGVPVVPDDLVLAALGLAADFYNSKSSSQGAVTAAMVGSYRLQYGDKKSGSYNGILESYRARRA